MSSAWKALRAATSWASPRSPAARRSTSPSACAGWAWRWRCSAGCPATTWRAAAPGARKRRRGLRLPGAQRRPDHPGDGRPRCQRLGAIPVPRRGLRRPPGAPGTPADAGWADTRAARRLLHPGGDAGGRHPAGAGPARERPAPGQPGSQRAPRPAAGHRPLAAPGRSLRQSCAPDQSQRGRPGPALPRPRSRRGGPRLAEPALPAGLRHHGGAGASVHCTTAAGVARRIPPWRCAIRSAPAIPSRRRPSPTSAASTPTARL